MPVASADGAATSFPPAKPYSTAAISRAVTSGDVGVTCRDVDVPLRLNNLCMSHRPPRPTTICHSAAPTWPRIESGVGAGQIVVLLDSGAGVSVISTGLVKDLGLPIATWPRRVCLADGTVVSALGCVRLLLVFGDLIAVDYEMVIAPELAEQCIVGVNLLYHLRAKLDFEHHGLVLSGPDVDGEYKRTLFPFSRRPTGYRGTRWEPETKAVDVLDCVWHCAAGARITGPVSGCDCDVRQCGCFESYREVDGIVSNLGFVGEYVDDDGSDIAEHALLNAIFGVIGDSPLTVPLPADPSLDNVTSGSGASAAAPTPLELWKIDPEFPLTEAMHSMLAKEFGEFFTDRLGTVKDIEHVIEMIPGATIPNARLMRMQTDRADALERTIQKQVDKNILVRRPTPYASQAFLVTKKGALMYDEWRLIVNFVLLNAITVPIRFPPPDVAA